MLAKIYKLGEEDTIVTTFYEGTHILGRGPTLECHDKRVSRNHATITIDENGINLTSTHLNPCFIKIANSKTITILKQGSATQLNDDDAFAFLPEDYWFKIKIEQGGEEPKNGAKSAPRSPQSCEDEPPDKKIKTEEVGEASTDENTTIKENNNVNKETIIKQEEEMKEEPANKDETLPESANVEASENIKPSTSDLNAGQDQPQSTSTNQSPEEADASGSKTNDNEDKDNNAKPQKPKVYREKCWYGANCYRKNPKHRDEYKHPGDSDFESDPDDPRPSCSFGATCYRKNKDHRKQYKHPPRQPPSKGAKKRIRKKVQRLNVADSQDLKQLSEELGDEEEDPFIDDDSDEFVGDSYDEDSDWDESQDPDDDENVKRLVKEAKRFVQN